MAAYVQVGDTRYKLIPISEEEFKAAFCSEHDEGARTIKALTGYPTYYVPGTRLMWPLPLSGLIIYEDNP